MVTHHQVEWSKLCLFVAGPPLYDTVISIHTRWEAFNTPPRFGEAGEESKDVSVTPTGGCHHHRHVFDAIVNQLKVEYSQLRQGNSKQLLYRMLDEVSRTTDDSQCRLDRSKGLCMYWRQGSSRNTSNFLPTATDRRVYLYLTRCCGLCPHVPVCRLWTTLPPSPGPTE